MKQQPEALRLADALEQAPAHTMEDGTILLYLGGTVIADKAAAELRRLHEVNAELLGALNAMLDNCYDTERDDATVAAVAAARTAIAKATGEQA